jgi:hypothetical protein
LIAKSLPTQAVVVGSRGAFFVTVIAEKSNYTEARQKMHPFHHHKLLHIMSVIRLKAFWYFYLRCLSAYNYIMCKGIKPSSHCLHLPNLPTPPTFQAVASHSLFVPHNFMPFTAPTAANKPRSSSYQLLNPTALSGCTRIQAGE